LLAVVAVVVLAPRLALVVEVLVGFITQAKI